MYEDVWSVTNKVRCKECSCYNPIEDSISKETDDGQVEWFADLYTCRTCGHRGAQVTRLVAKIKDDGKEETYDNIEGAFYQTDVR